MIRPLKKTPPPQNAQRPVQATPRPPQNAQSPTQATSRPSQNVQRPTQATARPAQNVQRPTQATPRPAQNAERPTQATARPVQNVQRPTQATPRPTQNAQRSIQTTPNAQQNNTNPIRNAQHSIQFVAQTQKKRTENDDFEIDEITYTKLPRVKHQRSNSADSAVSAVMSLVKAVIYIVAIVAISVTLSIFIVRTANDVFKFVGDEKLITVEIPEYATIEEIGTILGEAGVIEYPWAFNLWSNLKENPEKPPTFIAGTYEVSTMLNYDYLRSTFKKKTIREEVRITIPEGFTVDEIINLFVEENKIGTKEGFIDAINNYDFDYRFLDTLQPSPDRLYRLEGYLFPDTYYFYSDSSEVAVLTKLLDNFEKKFIDEYYDRCLDLGITVDEAIILASMVEKEARYADEMGNISSVFHNRLKYKATYPYLQSDATIIYAIQHDTGSRLDMMTGEDTEYETAYNTYLHKGLPPGPIANPGLNAIVYALYPSETEYFYFVANQSGRSLFAKTDKEHEQNIILARKGG